MKRQHLELIGLLATKSELISTYHIDYIYKVKVGDSLEGTMIQKGFDFDLYIPFQEIVRHLSSAYAPALQRVWTNAGPKAVRVLMSLHPDLKTDNLSIDGKWVLNCER